MASTNSDNALDRVRASAAHVLEHNEEVTLNREKITEFLENLDVEQLTKTIEKRRLPLSFDSPHYECNFWCVVDILNFASGYRHPLHEACDRGAYQTIMRGVLGMYITHDKLDADFFSNLTVGDIAEHFGFPIQKEVEVQPAIYEIKPTTLQPLARQILGVLHETARILKARRLPDLASFVEQAVDESDGTAAALVGALVETFPAFNDTGVFAGKEVCVYKKAQLLAAELHIQLSEADDRYKFPDVDKLTVMSDNVLPAVLRALGILELSEDLAAAIDGREFLAAGEREVGLRLMAVAAAEEIVAASAETERPLTTTELDMYLWSAGKWDQFRSVERHATIDTIYY